MFCAVQLRIALYGMEASSPQIMEQALFLFAPFPFCCSDFPTKIEAQEQGILLFSTLGPYEEGSKTTPYVSQSVRHFRDFMGLFFLQYISFAPDPYCHAFFSEEKKSQFFHPRFAFLFTISLCAHVEMTDFRRCYLSFPFLPRN